ncbi:hypothetical protein EVA_10923 [gut metagenome]|uniref:Uncharacterized protein n=1 Tax=gut metagenome TaxID=749906 RepID=J9G148_9ZZZZ
MEYTNYQAFMKMVEQSLKLSEVKILKKSQIRVIKIYIVFMILILIWL